MKGGEFILAPRRLHQFDADVCPHLVDQLITGHALAQRGIETKLGDQLLESCVAHDLLGHALQTVLEIRYHVGRNVEFRHLLLLDQDQSLRAILLRPDVRNAEGHKATQK